MGRKRRWIGERQDGREERERERELSKVLL